MMKKLMTLFFAISISLSFIGCSSGGGGGSSSPISFPTWLQGYWTEGTVGVNGLYITASDEFIRITSNGALVTQSSSNFGSGGLFSGYTSQTGSQISDTHYRVNLASLIPGVPDATIDYVKTGDGMDYKTRGLGEQEIATSSYTFDDPQPTP